MADNALLEELLTLERAALDCWARGDTAGYAGRLAAGATYFDHVTPARLHVRAAVETHVRAFAGRIDIPRHEIIGPAIHQEGDIAVLAFNWDPYDAQDRLIVR